MAHDLSGHRVKNNWLVVPPQMGDFPIFCQYELHWIWILKYSEIFSDGLSPSLQVHPGPEDAHKQVPFSCLAAGSLEGLEPDLILQRPALHSPSPCFCLLQLVWCGWSTCCWRLRQKVIEPDLSSAQLCPGEPSLWFKDKSMIKT